MIIKKLIKRGLLLLLIFIPILLNANTSTLYENKIWKALLHLDSSDKPNINTPSFLLSYDDFSAKNELEKTIEAFKKDETYMCKYPARYLWIKKNSNLNIEFDLRRCTKFNNYVKNTNVNNISLVFVSEDVSNPTSMMGHIFFKLDGVNYKGNQVQNAVSFFTIIETLNLPYLALQSTVLGMKGYFVLKPYDKQISQYLKNEDRNIWEYSLNLDSEQIKLLSYHFWELKNVDITYYFTGYNCATIVDDMLKIVSNDINKKEEYNLWLSPKDVIKSASSKKLIKNTKVITSNFTKNIKDKNPIYSQNDSQISILKKSEDNSIYFSFLPASHTIYDDNRQYSFESSLKIGEIRLKANEDRIKIDELNIFTMKSLIPWNNNKKIFSKELLINYTNHFNKDLKKHHVYNLSYSTGVSSKISDNIFIYDLIGAGVAYGDNSLYAYLKNQFGIIIYQLQSMKTTVQYTTHYNNFEQKELTNEFSFTQSFKLNNSIRLDTGYKNQHIKSKSKDNFFIGLSYVF